MSYMNILLSDDFNDDIWTVWIVVYYSYCDLALNMSYMWWCGWCWWIIIIENIINMLLLLLLDYAPQKGQHIVVASGTLSGNNFKTTAFK